MRKSIAIDMDGVMADVEAQIITYYEKQYGKKLTKKDLEGAVERQLFPEENALLNILHTPGFFRTLPVMENAIETIQNLMTNFDVYIVSAAMEFPLSLKEKYDWLEEHFPFISWKNIVLCGDKSIINTDFMIDDHSKNLDYFKGTPIMFHAFHNIHENHHKRVNNWNEVATLMQEYV